jgi:hypothetical protein
MVPAAVRAAIFFVMSAGMLVGALALVGQKAREMRSLKDAEMQLAVQRGQGGMVAAGK